MKKGLERLEKIVSGLDARIDALAKDSTIRESEKYYNRAIRDLYKKVLDNRRQGKPVVHAGIFIPHEIFRAMDIALYPPEFDALLSIQSDVDNTLRFMDRGEATGISKEVCSAHRIGLGMADLGIVPRPSFVVSSSAPCDVTNMTYELYARRFGCPAYLVDTPYGYGEKQKQYHKKDLRGLVSFLEEQTGRKMDWDRLKEIIEISSQGYQWWERINALRKNVPNPIKSRETTRDFAMTILGAGTPESIKFFEHRYQELQEMVARQEGAVKDEKYRITWLYVLPYFDLSIADWIEEKHGASIVVDLFSFASPDVEMTDTSDLIAFMANKAHKGGLVKAAYGPYDNPEARDDFMRMCKDYRTNIVMMLAHWGCKQYCSLTKLIRDDVAKEVDLPFLIIDADILDPRVVSSARVKDKIDEFLATVPTN